MRKGQLMPNGRLGKLGGYVFVDAVTVIDRLVQDGTDVMLTIRPLHEKERYMFVGNKQAVEWINRHSGYVYEAWYSSFDEPLHVIAMQS